MGIADVCVCVLSRFWMGGLSGFFFDVLYPDALFLFYHDVVGLSTIFMKAIFWGKRVILRFVCV